MAGQGKTTRKYAKLLSADSWKVIYTCVPNTVHLGVVPIQTLNGASKQRYPDIVAYKDNTLLLVEVEIGLNNNVFEDIKLRFSEMTETLSQKDKFTEWSNKIHEIHGPIFKSIPTLCCRLLLVKEPDKNNTKYMEQLVREDIEVVVLSDIE